MAASRGVQLAGWLSELDALHRARLDDRTPGSVMRRHEERGADEHVFPADRGAPGARRSRRRSGG